MTNTKVEITGIPRYASLITKRTCVIKNLLNAFRHFINFRCSEDGNLLNKSVPALHPLKTPGSDPHLSQGHKLSNQIFSCPLRVGVTNNPKGQNFLGRILSDPSHLSIKFPFPAHLIRVLI